MAEEGSLLELEGLEKQLQSLLSSYSSDDLQVDSKTFCSDYCKLVEEYASRWQTPLPRLRILETALCHFTRASSSFTSSCDHVLRTLSSLALSVFELLLFFDEQDFHEEPLKHFSVKFQECHVALLRHQNVHLLQVEPLLRAGGAWSNTTLKQILSDSSVPQNEVDRFLSSELPVFLELRLRYLLCRERVSEALALAKCCIRHPTAGKHLFFLQVYLTWLYKQQYNQLLKEVADLTGKDAVHIICSLEYEETNEMLLALCQVFLSQQLCRGDMYYLWELVFVWSQLHNRLNTSKQAFLEESRQLMLSATNVNSVFPFVRVVIQELGEDGVQFCVELCTDALKSCLPCDIITKSLIYKTIAGLLPNDLEVCRACALLVFFLERTVEAYKMVYLLYMLPDQDYYAEHSPIRNQIRFETLQVLKKDLYFDPEFWNLIALRANCLKLMNEKVVEELMEETWVPNFCAKEFSFVESTSTESTDNRIVKKPDHNDGRHKEIIPAEAPKKLKLGQGKTGLNDSNAVKKKANYRSRFTKETSSQPLRRSFWQLDRVHDIRSGQLRRATRLSEKNPPKRRIQKPKWLLEDSGNLQESRRKKHSLRHQRVHRSSALKRSENGQPKNSTHHPKVSESFCTKHESGFPLSSVEPVSAPQIILELSLPDNELMGNFTEDCNRQKSCPPMLFYKQTLKLPDPSHPVKLLSGKEVILRARDATMLVQLLHCYARRPKGKGNGSNIHGSVSTITRSSTHANPLKEPQRGLCEKPNAETRVCLSSEDADATQHPKPPSPVIQSQAKELLENTEMKKGVSSDKLNILKRTETHILGKTAHSPNTDKVHTTSIELSDEPSVEMKVTFASQSPPVGKVRQQTTTASTEVSQTFNTQSSEMEDTEYTSSASSSLTILNSDSPSHISLEDKQASVNIDEEQNNPKTLLPHSENGETCIDNDKDVTEDSQHEQSNHVDDISALVTKIVTQLPPVELPQDMEDCKQSTGTESKESLLQNTSNVVNAFSHTVPEPSTTANIQGNDQARSADGDGDDDFEDDETVETEESRLEYRCTFCQKDFKGRRVVIHAMFHFRKDECMFCGTKFKDDLLAMMHLSDHIEKLKRSKELASNKAQQTGVSETKDFSQPKTSAKPNVPNRLSGHHISMRLRRSSVCNKSVSHPEAHLLLESRNLRSNDQPLDNQFVQTNKQNERNDSKFPDRKVNGLIGKKNEFDQMKRTNSKAEDGQTPPTHGSKDKAGNCQVNHVMPKSCESFASLVQKRKHIECFKDDVSKDKVIQEKMVECSEKVDCPADGCTWSIDLSKNRVALLYHAMEHHYGDIKPLELSFKVANNQCSICKRVLWSFEHFQHHVERHRLSPRHPCLHLGCTARFKTGNEMRRHARKHSPLQAVCCLPGCSELFICLWALNLHEKEHYASKPTKPVKTVDMQTDNKPNCMQVKAVTSAMKGTLSCSPRNLREHASYDTMAKCVSVLPPAVKSSVVEEELKTRNESKHSILKNLSNKDTTTQSSSHSLNLRLRKGQTSKVNLVATKSLELPFIEHKSKLRQNFKKIQVNVNQTEIVPKRKRGRPRKLKRTTHDDNTTKSQNSISLKSEIPDGPETTVSSTVSNKLDIKATHKQVNNAGRMTEMIHQKSKSKKSVRVNTRSSRVERKISLDRSSLLTMASRSSMIHAHKLRVLNLRKRCASKDSVSLGASTAKTRRVTLRKSPRTESRLPATSREPAKSTFIDVAQESGDGKVAKTHSSKGSPNDGAPAVTPMNMKKTVTEKKTSDNTRHWKVGGKKKFDVTILPSLETESQKEPKSDSSSPTMFNLNRKTKEEPSHVTSEVSSSTTANLKGKSKKEPSDVTSDASSSTMVNLKQKSVNETSDVTSDDSSSTTASLERKSTEEASNVTSDASGSTMVSLKQKSVDETSDVTSDGSGSTTASLERKSTEEASNVTSDASGSTMVSLKQKSVDETSDVTSDGSGSTTASLERKSIEETSNVTSAASSSTTVTLKLKSVEDPLDVMSDGSSSTTTCLKRKSIEDPSHVMSDGSSSTTTNLERKSIEEASNVTSDKIKSKEEHSKVTSDGSSSTTSNLKRNSKKKSSNVTSECSGSNMSKLNRKSKEDPINVTNIESSSTMSTVQDEHTAHKPTSRSKDVQVRRNKAAKGIKKGEIKTRKKIPHPVQRTAKEATESKTEASKDSEVKAGEKVEENLTPVCAEDSCGYLLKSGFVKEYERPTFCIDTLAEYGKKHMRAPPTAYLDEKYTAMPKKRKVATSDFRPQEAPVTAAPQRQRCANCFMTFNSAKELQSHRHIQRCSNLFGFDSDEEGNS
ncbi:uncharacterized protein LOC144056878 isoform X1 [Vanacampus margaritifer]